MIFANRDAVWVMPFSLAILDLLTENTVLIFKLAELG